MKKRTIAATVGVMGLIGAAAVAPATAGTSSAVSLDQMVPLLAEPRTEADVVPESVDLGLLGNISEESVRLLGKDHAGTYWVGTTNTDDVCLIVQTAADPDMAASSCAPVADFYRDGLRLLAGQGMDHPTRNAEAYLLPVDIEVPGDGAAVGPSARSASGTGHTNTFFSGAPGDLDDLEAFEVNREDGTSFRFAPISREGL